VVIARLSVYEKARITLPMNIPYSGDHRPRLRAAIAVAAVEIIQDALHGPDQLRPILRRKADQSVTIEKRVKQAGIRGDSLAAAEHGAKDEPADDHDL